MNLTKRTIAVASTVMIVAAASFAQKPHANAPVNPPSATIAIQASTTFAKRLNAFPSMAIAASAVAGNDLPVRDALAGAPAQIMPGAGVASLTGAIQNGSSMTIAFGSFGYVMFRDAGGNGVGWHIKDSGWTLNKTSGGYISELDLETPFWLGDPAQGVSPALIQMMNSNSAVVLLSLQNTGSLTFNDLSGIGQKGKLAGYSSYTFGSSGYLYLYR